MRHVRPLKVFAAAVACMFSALAVRVWFAASADVWFVSCVVGAWLPLAAAAMFMYVRVVGDREDGIAAAWLVRALGVQSVLAWGVGMSDLFRGPPDHRSSWDADLGGPFVLLAFAVPFVCALAVLTWFRSVGERLSVPVYRPAAPGSREVGVAPFRGVAQVVVAPSEARVPLAPLVVAAFGSVLVLEAPVAPYWALYLSALPLAALTVRSHRAMWPSVATFAWLSALILVRGGVAGAGPSTAAAWPWLATSAVAFYLAAVEGLLRTRAGDARGTVARR
jgi:hypothetical protein